MNGRKIIIASSVALIGGVIFWLVARGGNEPESSLTTTPTKVRSFETLEVRNEALGLYIPMTGRVQPYEKVDLYPEVSGALIRGAKSFKEGIAFQKGQTILRIDSEILQLDVAAQKSSFLNTLVQMIPDLKMDYPEHFQPWDDYLKGFSVDQPLPALPEAGTPQIKYFLSARNVYNQYYSIKSLEKQLGRYRVAAPFSGTLTEARVNPGGQVSPQTMLGVLSSTESYELETAISLADLKHVNEGDKVTLTSRDIDGQWTGTIQRVGQAIDATNQSVPLFIDVPGEGLKEGVFLEGKIKADQPLAGQLVALPLSAIVQNDQVYIIQDSVARLHPVTPTRYLDDEVWVKGLEDGQQVIKDPGSDPLSGTKAIAKTK